MPATKILRHILPQAVDRLHRMPIERYVKEYRLTKPYPVLSYQKYVGRLSCNTRSRNQQYIFLIQDILRTLYMYSISDLQYQELSLLQMDRIEHGAQPSLSYQIWIQVKM